MGHRILVVALALATLLVAACASGPPRRISQPAASIQKLTVQADGRWSVSLRLQNYSSIPMRFDTVDLQLAVDGQAAGALRKSPALEIGPESADVITVVLEPDPTARMLLADALAARRGVGYVLEGHIQAAPVDRGGSRSYDIKRSSALTPAPGLPGVLR